MTWSWRQWCVVIGMVAGMTGAGLLAPRLHAQLSQGDLNSPDAVRAAVDQQVGRRVRLKLISGQDVEGQIARVGSTAVYVTELTGQEFFDATIRLDQVAAVIVRRPR